MTIDAREQGRCETPNPTPVGAIDMTDTQVTQLEACPFCGGHAISHRNAGIMRWAVSCTQCDCRPVNNFAKTEAEAVDWWNTRTPSTAAREPVEVVAWMYEHINGLMHYSRARDELLSMQPVEEWTETPLYAAPPTPDVAELVERLAWAIGKLDECGQQVEFTLGMARSLNDCRTVLAKHGGAK